MTLAGGVLEKIFFTPLNVCEFIIGYISEKVQSETTIENQGYKI